MSVFVCVCVFVRKRDCSRFRAIYVLVRVCVCVCVCALFVKRMCDMNLIHMCDTTHVYYRTHLYVGQDSSFRVTGLIHI